MDYKKIAENLDKLYSEEPELLFKLYNQLRKYFVANEDFKQFLEQSRTQFDNLIQKMDQRFEEINQRFEEVNKRFEEINLRFEEVNQRFEEVNKRFEKNDERFDNLILQMNQRFEEIDKRFENLTFYIDRRFNELAAGYGGTFEGFNKTILRKILEERGIPIKAFNVTPIHFDDPERTVHEDNTDVEINIFNEDPPIIGEVTSSLVEIEKLKIFIRKIQFIEERFNKEFKHFFIALYIDDKIQKDAKNLFKQYAIEAITLA